MYDVSLFLGILYGHLGRILYYFEYPSQSPHIPRTFFLTVISPNFKPANMFFLAMQPKHLSSKGCFDWYTMYLPSTQDSSHHQDYYVFSVENPCKPWFGTGVGDRFRIYRHSLKSLPPRVTTRCSFETFLLLPFGSPGPPRCQEEALNICKLSSCRRSVHRILMGVGTSTSSTIRGVISMVNLGIQKP